MDIRKKVLLSFAAALILGLMLYFASSAITKATGYSVYDSDFESCLAQNAIVLYISPLCPECSQEKAIISKFSDTVKFVDCNIDTKACSDLLKLPALSINNKTVYGIKNLAELRELTHC